MICLSYRIGLQNKNKVIFGSFMRKYLVSLTFDMIVKKNLIRFSLPLVTDKSIPVHRIEL